MSDLTENLQSLQMLDVKFISPSHTKGARVKITDLRFDESVTIPYNYEFNQALDVALDYINTKTTLKPYGYGTTKDNYFIVIKPVDHTYTRLKEAIKK